jgi:hypothetical protein
MVINNESKIGKYLSIVLQMGNIIGCGIVLDLVSIHLNEK